MRFTFPIAVFCWTAFLLAGDVVAVIGSGAGQKAPRGFGITLGKKDDVVDIQLEKSKTVFAIRSPVGISKAVIERLDENWPDVVVLRFHLKGLESFKASTGKVTLDAAVALRDGKPSVRLWKDGNETAVVEQKSPLWMEIRILADNGKPAPQIPLRSGYFEMTLPKAFFDGNPKSVTLNWIDFHR